jgi:hypothetical protein
LTEIFPKINPFVKKLGLGVALSFRSWYSSFEKNVKKCFNDRTTQLSENLELHLNLISEKENSYRREKVFLNYVPTSLMNMQTEEC